MATSLEQALIFIGSAVLLVPLFQRIGFGSVLGYLIAGMVVGPFGLRWIEDAESVMRFSEWGVVFLLFIIGLEIQPRKLWGMRDHLLGLGGLQVSLTLLIFMLIGLAFRLPLSVAVILGFGLSLSSTAFALQTLQEKNQLNTLFGRSSFSVLLMQDLMAIPALAFISAMGVSGQAGTSLLGRVTTVVLILFGLVGASRFLVRPIFRAIAATRSREVFTGATLFIVLGVAALMQQVGLSAALGSFLAGVLLADSEYRHELEADLEPFKSLLMGLFFIAIGMAVDLHLIYSHPFVMLGLAAGYLALKYSLIYGVGRLFRLNHENAKRMGLNIAQGGEFAFVIFGLTLKLGLTGTETISPLMVLITLSMALNPLVLWGERKLADLKRAEPPPDYDEIKEEEPEVIIAGYGRFGQIFGRVLRAQDIPFVAIDHDSGQVEVLRRFNNKVYYGDASRLDILLAAGAPKAKYFILAIDDVELSVKAAKVVIENFPHLKIFARARNRGHAFDLMDLGVQNIKRETFDSSLAFVSDLSVTMGMTADKVELFVERFRRHDQIMLEEQFKVRNDDKMFVSVSNQASAQLSQVLKEDSLQSRVSQ
jgi:monovalent cation:proton antiporter-2 (CPA2) family protein